eukprot:TRINITY_DN29178_c0_g1_i1.p1 TRINITY_DN29178_c0_g1~~TRINITY_DN29178_c0_g1_i1.p1  ORF type:complete len:752 (-),score=178.18 TRINITY_DN29178_c0_g1_i1:59-2314(-)
MAAVADILKSVPIFSKLNDEERGLLASSFIHKAYAAGQDIITQGDVGNEFFILVQGRAHVLKVSNSTESKVAELTNGDYFGEAALLNDDKRGATIRAISKCDCLALDAETFARLFSKSKLNVQFAKRKAVLAEPVQSQPVERDPALLVKTDDQKKFLKNSITKMTKLFKDLEEPQLNSVIDGMWKVEVKQGESIIKQGDPGDNFYVVESGEFDIFKNGEKVNHAGQGVCFGELALMYNAPRAATVTALTNSLVWALDRYTFRNNLKNLSRQKLEEYDAILKTVPILQSLLTSERQKVAEALEEVGFPDGQVIVRQGEPGDAFYIIKKGVVHVSKRDDKDGKEKQVAICKAGEFFGERALVNSEPRAATAVAKGAVECLTLNKLAFDLLLGPLQEILQRVKWDDKAAEAEAAAAAEAKDEKNFLTHANTPVVSSAKIGREELELVGLLGRGSFGLVQLMRHKVTKQTYALKQICKSQVVQLGQQEHVVSEKNVLSQMNHPFIVKLYSTYKDNDFLYFLLDVCLGGELFTLLRQRRCFEEETAKFYAASVVLAFEYMHERDIIYRDLKPENLLLDSQGYIKIVDFGFAKVCKDRTYTLCGTPDYLAPEVIFGQGHGKGVDWWTLGVLIYEMVASYPPFYDDDPMKTYGKIMHGVLDFPRFFSSEVVDLLQKLLHPKATRRLGVINGGASLIKSHPWFSGFDWDALYKKQLKAPFIPEIRNVEDLSNFAEVSEEEEQFDFPPYEDDGTGWDQEF